MVMVIESCQSLEKSYSTGSGFTDNTLPPVPGLQAVMNTLKAPRATPGQMNCPSHRLARFLPPSKHPFSLLQTLGLISRVTVCASLPGKTPVYIYTVLV